MTTVKKIQTLIDAIEYAGIAIRWGVKIPITVESVARLYCGGDQARAKAVLDALVAWNVLKPVKENEQIRYVEDVSQ